jgi:hypothetical protein
VIVGVNVGGTMVGGISVAVGGTRVGVVLAVGGTRVNVGGIGVAVGVGVLHADKAINKRIANKIIRRRIIHPFSANLRKLYHEHFTRAKGFAFKFTQVCPTNRIMI